MHPKRYDSYETGRVAFANRAAIAAMQMLIDEPGATPKQVADMAWEYARALVLQRPKPLLPDASEEA